MTSSDFVIQYSFWFLVSGFGTTIQPMLRFLPALLLLVVGCARYEYDIIRPTDLAMHIGKQTDAIAPRLPLEYRFRAVENRLVMSIYNTTDDPIQLVGERSSVVDPEGQSHPLRSQPIAPNSFIKQILPPYRPRIERGGPTFGIGIGTHVGYHRRRAYPYDAFDDSFYDEPRYFAVIEDDALYWNWSGEGQIRMMLVFMRGEESFTHEFVIQRVKM
jgi:hypothetical protein